MAKIKSELLREAKKLKLEVSTKNTIAEIQSALKKEQKLQEVASIEAPEASAEQEKVKVVAKAGKRSVKGQTEAEEKQIKLEKQRSKEDSEKPSEKPKKIIKPTRSKLERRGKKYRELAKLIDKTKQYSLKEAIDLATQTSTTKFDSSVELHIRLNVDPKQADQNIRDNVVLPSGSGKTVRVAVFADEENAKKALKAGADVAGNEDLLAQLDKEELNFDVLIAMPKLMIKLAKYARVLGPKGLMPNPKSGTVTADVVKAVEQAKAGKVEYRVDSYGIIHLGFGKVSFGYEKLQVNADVIIDSIKQNKPSSIKGAYTRSIWISTTMGPSIQVLPSEL